MRSVGHQHPRRLGRKVALHAIYSAFKWLADRGASSHTVEWLGDYPLLSASSPRGALLTRNFLCCNPDENGDGTAIPDPITRLTLGDDRNIAEQLVKKKQYTAFAYLDCSCCPPYSIGEALSKQRQAIRELFDEEHYSENLVVVRSDNLHSNGCNSIREIVTNLIAAEFLISKGYMVLEDTRSGPDVIAIKTSLLQSLRERGFIGRGTILSQLATIRALGKVNDSYREVISEDEVIAVESESVSPRKGMKQLMGGYESERFSYMGFFDRRILAAPFLNQGATTFDVLTYDTNGLEYRKCEKPQAARDFWRSKKQAFMNDLENSIRTMLLANLTFEEIASMTSNGPQTVSSVFHEIPKIHTEKILDKLENVMQSTATY